MKVISTEKRLCTCCMEEHNVKTVFVQEQNSFKNTPVEYTAEYLYCDAADEFYMEEEQIQKNDISMKDAYKRVRGLLTSKEICEIRAKYKISQSDLCTLLGWGGKTITRYESHQVQDKAHDTILKKLNADPEWFLYLLNEAKESIAEDVYQKYLETASCLFEESQDNYLRTAIQSVYARFHNNAKYNGKATLSLNKVVDVIRYFANSTGVTNLYKVKLMKLLWYADFLSYKRRGYAITGLVYQALPMGAVPVGHDSLIRLCGVEYEEFDMGDGTAYKFLPTSDKTYQALSDDEKQILDVIIQRFGAMSKNELVTFMHKEKAYTETAMKDIISYEYAEELSL